MFSTPLGVLDCQLTLGVRVSSETCKTTRWSGCSGNFVFYCLSADMLNVIFYNSSTKPYQTKSTCFFELQVAGILSSNLRLRRPSTGNLPSTQLSDLLLTSYVLQTIATFSICYHLISSIEVAACLDVHFTLGFVKCSTASVLVRANHNGSTLFNLLLKPRDKSTWSKPRVFVFSYWWASSAAR